KPMVEIGGKPILWHIMKYYASFGFNEFIICLGYKGFMIKEYFLNYFAHNSDITIDLKNNSTNFHHSKTENFKVTLIDTGINTKTAGRLKQVKEHIGNQTFMLTYGDGLTDLNLKELLTFHKSHGKIVTLTSTQPAGRFGSLEINQKNLVKEFIEKPRGDRFWINAGFFILEPKVFDYLPKNADEKMWEEEPLISLARDKQLVAFKYCGFWKCMDALRDKIELDDLWKNNSAPWKIW
ncbi:MAG: glucose-1-phosphate cytidylyltransferase, partial [Elusimicrobiota bacterium]